MTDEWTSPEIGVFHLDIELALVVVETSQFGVEVLTQLGNALQQTVTLVRQSIRHSKETVDIKLHPQSLAGPLRCWS